MQSGYMGASVFKATWIHGGYARDAPHVDRSNGISAGIWKALVSRSAKANTRPGPPETSSRPFLLFNHPQAVADARFVEDVDRVVRVVAQLAAKVLHGGA